MGSDRMGREEKAFSVKTHFNMTSTLDTSTHQHSTLLTSIINTQYTQYSHMQSLMQQPADEEKEEAESPLLKYQSIEHKIEEDKMNIMEAKKKDPRKAVGLMWKIHFFVGLLALCFGMMCNGGGRYVLSPFARTSSDFHSFNSLVYG